MKKMSSMALPQIFDCWMENQKQLNTEIERSRNLMRDIEFHIHDAEAQIQSLRRLSSTVRARDLAETPIKFGR